MKRIALLLLLAGCSDRTPQAAAQAAPAPAGDWPTFLGPDHTGISRETGLLKSWPEKGPPVLWKMELGDTYSAPSAAGEALVVFHRVKDEEVVERLDAASGARRWRFAYPTAYADRFRYNGGPRSSPTIDGGKVYTLGAEGVLACVDLETGKADWKRALHDEYFKEGGKQNFFGVGVAPRIDGDRILLNLGDDRSGCVTAIDKKTGKDRWRVNRGTGRGEDALAERRGRRELLDRDLRRCREDAGRVLPDARGRALLLGLGRQDPLGLPLPLARQFLGQRGLAGGDRRPPVPDRGVWGRVGFVESR